MNKKELLHLIKIFIYFYSIFLIKFIYLFIWGWIKHDVIYWFDDAFLETFKAAVFPFIAYVFYFKRKQHILAILGGVAILLYFFA